VTNVHEKRQNTQHKSDNFEELSPNLIYEPSTSSWNPPTVVLEQPQETQDSNDFVTLNYEVPPEVQQESEEVHSNVNCELVQPPTLDLSCTHCDMTFQDSLALRKHKLRIHFLGSREDGDFQCSFCLKYFTQQGTMERHVNTVHYNNFSVPQHIKCYICIDSPIYSTSEELFEHERSIEHQQELGLRVSVYCNVCRKNFSHECMALHIHLESHEHQMQILNLEQFSGESFFCIPCRKGFPSMPDLLSHNGSSSHKQVCIFRENLMAIKEIPVNSQSEANIVIDNFEKVFVNLNTSMKCTSLFEINQFKIAFQVDIVSLNKLTKAGNFFYCSYALCYARSTSETNLRMHMVLKHSTEHLKNGLLKPCVVCFRVFLEKDIRSHLESHDHLKCPVCGDQNIDAFNFLLFFVLIFLIFL